MHVQALNLYDPHAAVALKASRRKNVCSHSAEH